MRSGNNQHSAPWTEREIELMRTVYPSLFPEEEASFFPGRTHKSLREKAKVLKIRRVGRVVYSPKKFGNDADGGYVTGLTDGEGSFMVSIRSKNGEMSNFNPKFGINLRADDKPILDWMARYFGCGTVHVGVGGKRAPIASLWIASAYDLLSSVVPHFTAYPLRAKKKRDFEIWLKILGLTARYYRCDWPDQVRRQMLGLYAELRGIRRYQKALP